MTAKRAIRISLLPLLLCVSLLAIFVLDLGEHLGFQALGENREWLTARAAEDALIVVPVFVVLYALAVALSIPGATLFTLAGGFLFGTFPGAFYAVLGATTGAALVFLIARSSFGEIFRTQTEGALAKLRKGFCRNALNYLLFLRLVPLFPFWLINLATAYLDVPLRIFILGTAVGIVPGALIYASIGNGLGVLLDRGEVPDLGIIFSPTIFFPLLGLAMLSLAPILYKRLRRGESGA